MIIKDFQLINSINSEKFHSFLIYGPNEGLIRENIDIIYKNFSKGAECEKVSINGKQLDESISLLNDEISTISLFSEKKFILLESVKEKHTSIIEDAYYKLTRVSDNFEVIPFGTGSLNYTRLSYDASGSYFDLSMELLDTDTVYEITLNYKINGTFVPQPEKFRFRTK